MTSKSMIETTYKNISFDGCTFKNILCIGESSDASLIKFTSSDYGNTLNLNNISIENCNSNGDFIVIDGNNSNINISNIKINDIISYGSLLNNKSTKVNSISYRINIIYMYKLKFCLLIYIYIYITLKFAINIYNFFNNNYFYSF